MKILNNTGRDIVAFCSHTSYGMGNFSTIKPNDSAIIEGPIIKDGKDRIFFELPDVSYSCYNDTTMSQSGNNETMISLCINLLKDNDSLNIKIDEQLSLIIRYHNEDLFGLERGVIKEADLSAFLYYTEARSRVFYSYGFIFRYL